MTTVKIKIHDQDGVFKTIIRKTCEPVKIFKEFASATALTCIFTDIDGSYTLTFFRYQFNLK